MRQPKAWRVDPAARGSDPAATKAGMGGTSAQLMKLRHREAWRQLGAFVADLAVVVGGLGWLGSDDDSRRGGGEADNGGATWRLRDEGSGHDTDTLRANGKGADWSGEEASGEGDGGAKGGGGGDGWGAWRWTGSHVPQCISSLQLFTAA
jgi:hypothetical protein